ncbi:MAG: FAD-dependent oxidoreductase [Hyphomicrobiaceae bacterium]
MEHFDIIVVGAGIAGSSAAFHLADKGIKTALIEKTHPAGGPTGRSSALTHAFYLDQALSKLSIRGVQILRDIPRLTGQGKVHNEIGMMWACGAEAEDAWKASARWIASQGSRIDILAPDVLGKMAPDFSREAITTLLYEPDYGYADPYGAANALVKGARDRGCRALLNTRVTKLVTSGGKITGVTTEDGQGLTADRVLVCAGVWTRPLIAQAGCDLPIHVERHEMAVLDAKGRARTYMPFAWCDDLLCNYARPDGDNVVLCGTWAGGGTGIRHQSVKRPSPVDNPDIYKEGLDDEESVHVLSFLTPRAPRLTELGVRPGYAGLYDMSPDDNPIIDRVPGVDGLYVVCGSSGHGFKMGAGVGEAAAAMAMTGQPSALLAPFTVKRFAGFA